MTLPLITSALLRGPLGDRAVGYVYAVNTLGAIVGVVVAVHFALPVLGIKGGLLLGAGIDIALGIVLLLARRDALGARQATAWGGTGVLAMLVVAFAVRRASRAHWPRACTATARRASRPIARSCSIATARPPRSRSSRSGDDDHHHQRQARCRDRARRRKPHVRRAHDGHGRAAAARVQAGGQAAAVIGFGSGMTTTTLLGSPVLERVDTIEIEPQMVEGARRFGPIVEPAFADPRSRIVIDDAKSYFARSNVRYDLIVSEPSNPWVSGVSSLFTQEFYAHVKRQLAEGGLFVQWIHVYEFNDRLLATILRALDAEFGDYEIYAANEGDLVIVASVNALPGPPTGAYTAWRGLAPLVERVRLGHVDELHLRRLLGKESIQPLLAVLGDGLNSDYYPIVDQAAPLARFVGRAADGLMRVASAPIPMAELAGDAGPLDATPATDPLFPPTRRAQLGHAREMAEFLRSGSTHGASPSFAVVPLALLRAHLWNCAKLPPGVRMPELMLAVADTVNPALPAAQAAGVWDLLRKAPCSSALDSADRDWLDLFAAVGARDYPRMAGLGSRLATSGDIGDDLRGYAVMAAAAGLVGDGRRVEARRFLATMAPRLPHSAQQDPALRFLGALTRIDPAANDAAGAKPR